MMNTPRQIYARQYRENVSPVFSSETLVKYNLQFSNF